MDGFCCNCNIVLTLQNAQACRVKSGNGRCRDCLKKYKHDNRERLSFESKQRRLRDIDKRISYETIYNRSLRGRFKTLTCALRKESISRNDALWNFNFYSGFIQNAVCHYCLDFLNETGGGLDRISNNVGHTCFNVVPCCRKCNRIKGNDTSYEEMFLLVPALREIVKLKSLKAVA